MKSLLLTLSVLGLVAPRWGDAAAAGDFTSSIMVHNGTTSRPLTLADGHLLLSEGAAGACGYRPSTFGTQNKLVLAYWAGVERGLLNFFLCNSGDFMQNFWLITCPRPLETRGGADADSERCWCQLPEAHHPCSTGAYGFQITADTIPGHWYYMVVQANPPETGDDPSRTFTLTIATPPFPPSAATPDAADANPPASVAIDSGSSVAGAVEKEPSKQEAEGRELSGPGVTTACNDSADRQEGAVDPHAESGSQRVCVAAL